MNLGTIIRLLAIALGIMSAVLLAHSALGIRFNEDFLWGLAWVEWLVGQIVWPVEQVVVPMKQWLHDQGIIFDLYAHWRNAFVLLWLLFGTEMRVALPIRVNTSLGTNIHIVVRWLCAALAALVGGLLAGTVPLDHPAVLWWPVMALFLNDVVDYFIVNNHTGRLNLLFGGFAVPIGAVFAALAMGWIEPISLAGEPSLFWWAAAGYFALLVCRGLLSLSVGSIKFPILAYRLIWLAACGVLALGLLPEPQWLSFRNSPSPGLANLAAFVAVMAASHATSGAFFAARRGEDRYLDRWFAQPGTHTALDIFAVLGVAAFIVWLGNALA